ncbi:MAG: DUF2281 domain-containing protein [Chloroherpetonaceae bacterium]|nr:DUF2281 domain-containing protein [Chloroherpetonaceae bacterium]MCS7210384.1 DUF2281 domain-containing protein [Chloroherpetonaceae bacterium]MDW8438659.1 DUF2281 domain-containing protein [Chloroherpetonaceae bacterium]MDW8465065.1 DUF2281 domain-containing protein [Chloroherpetonaceae bacterium]
MKTIETIVEIGDDQTLRAKAPLPKGAYRAVIVIDEQPIATEANPIRRFRQAGTAKGKIWMADDFDETPEDFKDYM